MKIPQEELMQALEDAESSTANPGFCLACGALQDGCEPDARRYECEECGKPMVYDAAEILLMGAYS